MTGTEGLVLQQRDRRLLEALETMRIVDRDQAMAFAGFRSITRANARLLRLAKAGLLKRLFIGTMTGNRKALYLLSNKGAAVVGVKLWHLYRRSGERLVVDPIVEHQLTVNAVRIAVSHQQPPTATRLLKWMVFTEPISTEAPIAPDGYFEIQSLTANHPMFLEVDRGTEGQKIWKKKTESYLRLAMTGEFARRFGQERFRVLVVVNSQRRLDSIRTSVAKHTEKIFWFATLQTINSDGFWSTVWLRPTGTTKHSLL